MGATGEEKAGFKVSESQDFRETGKSYPVRTVTSL
jgi:hypothetical protein